jgi:hypothetical protein
VMKYDPKSGGATPTYARPMPDIMLYCAPVKRRAKLRDPILGPPHLAEHILMLS